MDSDSSSLTTMPSLPPELIVEILSRLSVKPLLLFKCVSKSWLALISSPEFAKIHLSIAANNKDCTHHRFVLTHRNLRSTPYSYKRTDSLKDCSVSSFLINDSLTEAVDLDFPMMEPLKRVCVVGSVNGLICLHVAEGGLFLWNPSIRKFKKLPDLERIMSNNTYCNYGFGYDVFHDDYKVVELCYCLDGYDGVIRHLEVKIYSLKSDSWRRTSDFPSGMYFYFRNTFVNGELVWLGKATGPRIGAVKRDIVSFDLTDEKWVKVEEPSYGGEGYIVSQPLRLGSDLSIICEYPTSHADLWVMKENGIKESWTRVYTIKYPIDPDKYLFSGVSSVIRIRNRGEILLVSGRTFMIYNPDDESIKSFRYPNVFVNTLIATSIYIESLVCPLLQDEPDQE